ncbi:hypothetical protein K501DRAFT_170510 [Backusella circina FSU 941]|nr:hypothetical protein K501DRAFT_170510 [Backusella circina FSU 941]
MVKIAAYFLIAISTLIMATIGCDDACTADRDAGGKCYYSCTNACHFSENHNRNQFLNGLSNRGFECQPEAYNSLSCVKKNGFGGCWGHKWTCGSGC